MAINKEPLVFPSAVDSWFYLLLVGVGVFVLAVTLPVAGPIASLAVLALSLGLPLWLLFSTNYRVESGTLRARSGPFSWTIPLAEIHSVEPSRSPFSSPALSLDRLQINYGRGRSLLVSPADRRGFLAAIGQALPKK